MTINFLHDDLVVFLPEIFLTICLSFLLIYGVIISVSKYLEFPIIIANLNWLAIQVLCFVLLILSFAPFKMAKIFNNLLFTDSFALFFKILIIIASIITLLIIVEYNHHEKINSFEYIILLLLAIVGGLLLINSYDLISLYLALELHSFCLYILASIKRTSEFSTEAGLKYFILGAFSSGLLLFGASIIYGFLGTTNFDEISHLLLVNLEYKLGIIIGFSFICIGFFFKLSAAPFHFWMPDIYEGSPTSITCFFAIVPKIAILGVFMRIIFDVFSVLLFPCQQFFIALSIISMLVGTFGSLWQIKLKRLLAYSSIGHIGYILIGLTSATIDSVYSIVVYFFVYLIMTIAIFDVLLILRKHRNLTQIKYLKDLANLIESNPCISIFFSVVLFSMCGIPPLFGFFSKKLLFIMAIKMNLLSLVILSLILSCVACFYYIRIVKIMFFETSKTLISFYKIEKLKAIVLVFASMLLFLLFLSPMPLFNLIHNCCLSLFN